MHYMQIHQNEIRDHVYHYHRIIINYITKHTIAIAEFLAAKILKGIRKLYKFRYER